MFKRLLILLSFSLLLSSLSLPLIAYAADTTVSDGFDFPLGKPNGAGYGVEGQGGLAFLDRYDYSRDGIAEYHPGEDWNDNNSGLDFGGNNDDKGDPIYATSNGVLKYAKFGGSSWGYLVMIEHTLPNGEKYWSQYGHLASIPINIQQSIGLNLDRGDLVGYVGDYPHGSGLAHHLHFEIRKKYRKAEDFVSNWTQAQVQEYYVDPSDFIDSHRPITSPAPNLASSNTAANSTTLTWDKASFPNFDHYELYRSTEAGGTSDPIKRTNLLSSIDAKSVNVNTFTDSTLSPNTDYFYSLSAFNISGFSISSPEISLKTTTGTQNITQNKYDQRSPKISGKYITWNDQRINEITGNTDKLIYFYDTEKNQAFSLNVGITGSSVPADPAIYNNKVVYVSRNYRYYMYGDMNIYYFDLEKNGGTGVPITEATGNQRNAVIYDNFVVWQDESNTQEADIYFLDLNKSDGPSLLVNDPFRQVSPKIWQDKVVYVDTIVGQANLKYSIMMIDINTKEKTVIAEKMAYAYPYIDAGKVVWSKGGSIYIYDINTKTTEILNKNANFAVTRQGRVIYDTIVGNTSSIHIYNIQTKIDVEVVQGLKYSSLYDYSNGILVYSSPGVNEIVPSYMDIFMVKGNW